MLHVDWVGLVRSDRGTEPAWDSESGEEVAVVSQDSVFLEFVTSFCDLLLEGPVGFFWHVVLTKGEEVFSQAFQQLVVDEEHFKLELVISEELQEEISVHKHERIQ